jgi:hypothetical protein
MGSQNTPGATKLLIAVAASATSRVAAVEPPARQASGSWSQSTTGQYGVAGSWPRSC